MGYLYRPTLKSGGAGRIIWCKYYVNGRAVRESTGCEKEQAATRFLKEREGRVAIGMPILPRADRIRYEELAEDLAGITRRPASGTRSNPNPAWRTWTPSSPRCASRTSRLP
jgi:hypothetical protein